MSISCRTLLHALRRNLSAQLTHLGSQRGALGHSRLLRLRHLAVGRRQPDQHPAKLCHLLQRLRVASSAAARLVGRRQRQPHPHIRVVHVEHPQPDASSLHHHRRLASLGQLQDASLKRHAIHGRQQAAHPNHLGGVGEPALPNRLRQLDAEVWKQRVAGEDVECVARLVLVSCDPANVEHLAVHERVVTHSHSASKPVVQPRDLPLQERGGLERIFKSFVLQQELVRHVVVIRVRGLERLERMRRKPL